MPIPLSHRKIAASLVQKARRDIPYEEISRRLVAYGVEMDNGALRKVFSSGTMQASLMLMLLDVLGVTDVNIPDLLTDLKKQQQASPTRRRRRRQASAGAENR